MIRVKQKSDSRGGKIRKRYTSNYTKDYNLVNVRAIVQTPGFFGYKIQGIWMVERAFGEW